MTRLLGLTEGTLPLFSSAELLSCQLQEDRQGICPALLNHCLTSCTSWNRYPHLDWHVYESELYRLLQRFEPVSHSIQRGVVLFFFFLQLKTEKVALCPFPCCSGMGEINSSGCSLRRLLLLQTANQQVIQPAKQQFSYLAEKTGDRPQGSSSSRQTSLFSKTWMMSSVTAFYYYNSAKFYLIFINAKIPLCNKYFLMYFCMYIVFFMYWIAIRSRNAIKINSHGDNLHTAVLLMSPPPITTLLKHSFYSAINRLTEMNVDCCVIHLTIEANHAL